MNASLRSRVGMVLLLAAGALAAAAEAELPVVFQENFEGENPLARWELMDPAAWKIADQDGNKVLSMFQDSKYKPPVRSPQNIGILKDLVVGDFVLELRMQSLTKDYGHRDLCLVFGYQDPSHYYYVHMALKADANAHSVFLVDDKPRVSIAKERTAGLVWGDGWHKVKLERRVGDGSIRVYFDDLAKPIMVAEDKRFPWGRLGVGSFDDEGNFDDITIRGTKVEPAK